MNISIIGGAGFIGQSLFQYFYKKKYNVTLIDTEQRFSRVKLSDNKTNIKICDYEDKKSIELALKKTEILINLFCKTEPKSSMKSIINDANSNILTNVRIFEISKNIGVKKIIFSSSGGAVYGVVKNIPIKETEIKNPISAYGASKISSEKYLSLYKNIECIILRISNAYGPLQFYKSKIGIISKILESIKESKDIIIEGNGNVLRDYIYIEDICRAFFISATNNEKLKSDAYNIGTGYGKTINELIDLTFKLTNKKCKVFYSDERKFDIPKNVLDHSKFSKLTNWQPRVSLDEGIKLMWKYLNSN